MTTAMLTPEMVEGVIGPVDENIAAAIISTGAKSPGPVEDRCGDREAR